MAGSSRSRAACERRDRHRDVGLLDAVEPRGELRDRLDAAMAHGVADRAHDVEGGLDVEVGARHDGAVVGGGLRPGGRCGGSWPPV